VLHTWKQKAEEAARVEVERSDFRKPLPEDAAELELSVGGRAILKGATPRAVRYSHDSSGTCDRHDYELTITVRNLGNERLHDYHVDVEFPALALEQPETHPNHVGGRSTRRQTFFRASDANAPELFPGDSFAVLTIPYFVDDDIFWNHRRRPEDHAYKQPVRVTLYRSGLPPLVVERPFELLSNF
jgi:hypothetical protein